MTSSDNAGGITDAVREYFAIYEQLIVGYEHL